MFRTPVSLSPFTHPISLDSKLLSVGSCFADFIGGKLAGNKFRILANPLGIVYHPLALFEILELAFGKALPPDNSYVCSQGVWYNYYFHGCISNTSLTELEKQVVGRLEELAEHLKDLDYLLLTFGTALQYKHINTGQVVANCHKVPQQEFNKSLTPVDSIVGKFNQLWSYWDHHKPRVILSVSPIRHIKEGLIDNSISKSVLRVACEEIRQSYHLIEYFPGYEIMLDDLRDYRFYENDMVHPNYTARDYIWKLFKNNYLDESAQNFIEQWQKISLNLEHRPFHPQSTAHQEFLQKTLKLIEQLPEKVDASDEIAFIKQQLK